MLKPILLQFMMVTFYFGQILSHSLYFLYSFIMVPILTRVQKSFVTHLFLFGDTFRLPECSCFTGVSGTRFFFLTRLRLGQLLFSFLSFYHFYCSPKVLCVQLLDEYENIASYMCSKYQYQQQVIFVQLWCIFLYIHAYKHSSIHRQIYAYICTGTRIYYLPCICRRCEREQRINLLVEC